MAIIDEAFVRILPDFKLFSSATRAGITKGFATAVPTGTASGGKVGAAAASAAVAGGTRGSQGWLAKFKSGFSGGNIKAAFAAIVVGVALAGSKMASDFQAQMIRLVTAAGETQSNLKLISKGVLQTARDTGTNIKELSGSIYFIESAGIHGSAALAVLKAAAQGAKVDIADAATVANALTTAMIDIGRVSKTSAATMMSQLIATVSRGKLTMQDLATSLHSVLPNAAALGLSFAQTGAAIATMTAQGISAEQATQNLNHAILSIANPTAVQTKTMAAFGLNASIVARDLGRRGLTGTLAELSKAITDHMGPAGLTITRAMNSSAIATGKANEMFKNLDPTTQHLAQELINGTLTTTQFRHAINKLTDHQANLARQWLVTEHRARGFSDLLKSASPSALTYVGALSKMTGGQVGLQVALHLTGQNMPAFLANVQAISKAHQDAAGNVDHWAIRQTVFNQKMAQLKQVVVTSAIAIGTYLLPVLSNIADFIMRDVIPAMGQIGHIIGGVVQAIRNFSHWVNDNKVTLLAVAAAITTFLLPTIITFGVQSAVSFGETIALWTLYGIEAMVNAAKGVAAFVMLNIAGFQAAAKAVISFGITIALWAMYGTEALVNAAKVAAAWIIAMGPIGWITVAIIALVALVIWKWKTIKEWTVRIFTDVSGFIKKHWQLILALIVGPLGLIVLAVVKNWDKILRFTQRFWNDTGGFIIHIVNEIIMWLEHHWGMMIFFIITGGLGLILRTIILHWQGIKSSTITIWTAITNFFIGLWNTLYAGFFAAVHAVATAMFAMYHAVLAWGSAIVAWFVSLPGVLKSIFVSAGRWLGKAGHDIFFGLYHGALDMWNAVSAWFASVVRSIKNFFASAPGWLAKAGHDVFFGFYHGALDMWNRTVAWFQSIYMWIVHFGSDAGKWLLAAGKDVITGLWNGLKHVWDSIVDWFKGLPKKILGYLGISSPPQWAIDAGMYMMKGIIKGIIMHAGGAAAFLGRWAAAMGTKIAGAVSIGGPNVQGLIGDTGSGLIAWVLKAMNLTGVGGDWFAPLIRRVMYESGGDPNAINLSDRNALEGHPSMGLMQTIASTFAAYALPGHGDIWNPVDNMVAAIRYIISRYGSITSIDPPVSGYRQGAWNVERDKLAMVHQREMIIPARQAEAIRRAGNGDVLNPAAIGDAVARALSGMAIRFDGDGLARLVRDRQSVVDLRGARR